MKDKPESARGSVWAQIWEERGRNYPDDNPAFLDGFDHGAGKMGEQQVVHLVERARRRLELSGTSRLLEVGCGAGTLLGPLSAEVAMAVGCDLSESMLQRVKRQLPGLNLVRAEAGFLPFQAVSFDAILMNSVFQYLPREGYALSVLKELSRVSRPSGRIFVSDVPDKKKSELGRHTREEQALLDAPPWRSSVDAAPEHRQCDYEFFEAFCRQAGHTCQIEPQDVPGYGNARFRFNVLMQIPQR